MEKEVSNSEYLFLEFLLGELFSKSELKKLKKLSEKEREKAYKKRIKDLTK